jgi:hypothetical protein
MEEWIQFLPQKIDEKRFVVHKLNLKVAKVFSTLYRPVAHRLLDMFATRSQTLP